MKKVILSSLFFIAIGITASAQMMLGYYREGQGSLNYTRYKRTSGSEEYNINGVSLDMRVNYSLLGALIWKRAETPFTIGDHIGAGFSMGYFKKPGDDFPFMLGLNLEFGLKAAYAINDDLEVGLKYMLGAGNYYTDLSNDFGVAQRRTIVPSVRLGKYMGTLGFGPGTAGQDGIDGKFFMAEGRLLLGDDEDGAGFLFLRAENYSNKQVDGDGRNNVTQFYFGFGIM